MKRLDESSLLDFETILAEVGFTKIRSEYISMLYRAHWKLGRKILCIYQVDESKTPSYEVW